MRIEEGKTYCAVLSGTLETIIFQTSSDNAGRWSVPAVAKTQEVSEPDPVTGKPTRQVRLQLTALTKLRLVEEGIPAISHQHLLTVYEADDELAKTYSGWVSDWNANVKKAMQQRQQQKASVGKAVQQMRN